MRTQSVSADEVLDAVSIVVVGGGLLTAVLFPFAVPIIALVVVPLIAIGLVAAIPVAIVAAPFLLFRLARSLVGRA